MKARLSLVLALALFSINWTIRDLGTLPGGRGSFATAINNHGEIVGAATNAAGRQRAVVFGPAAVFEIPTAAGFGGSIANDINDNRMVVGQSPAGGFMYPLGGSLTALGARTGAYAVSPFNDIGGYEWYTSSEQRGYIWFGGARPYDIGFLGTGDSTTVRDVANRKAAAGWAGYEKGESAQHAFLYYAGAMIDLGTLGGQASGADALVMNDYPDPFHFSTHVVGFGDTASGEIHAFHWNAGTMTDLGTLPGDMQSRALGINKFKVSVGYSQDAAGKMKAVMWVDGTIVDLNTLIPPKLDWNLTIAFGINDHGQIVGGGTHDGLPRAFVLTP